MRVLRNGMFALVFLLLGGCMMMDMHGSHGAPMETARAGTTPSKDTSRHEAPAAEKQPEMKAEQEAPHTGNTSSMAILGGALMVVMMLAVML